MLTEYDAIPVPQPISLATPSTITSFHLTALSEHFHKRCYAPNLPIYGCLGMRMRNVR